MKEKTKAKVRCPREECRADRVVKHGSVMTVNKGLRVRYKCQKCGHTFYQDEDKESK